jgi:hypothetical protein
VSTITRKIQNPLPLIEVDDEHEYEVEYMLDLRNFNLQPQHLIHWYGYNDVSEHI